MQALRGKSLDQQTQSLTGQINVIKNKLATYETELDELATTIEKMAEEYKSKLHDQTEARQELQMLEAQRAVAASAAAQEVSADSNVQGLLSAALQSKIPEGGCIPPALTAK
eukprot:7403629-Pyramimonas_sp.AAC.1